VGVHAFGVVCSTAIIHICKALACRNVLDILRNNSRLEALYAMAAGRAFQFCLHYKRTTEFRRLCDILRNHLSNLIK
jgi:hypothetical protein